MFTLKVQRDYKMPRNLGLTGIDRGLNRWMFRWIDFSILHKLLGMH